MLMDLRRGSLLGLALFSACASPGKAPEPLPPEIAALVGRWRAPSKFFGYSSHEVVVSCSGELTTQGWGNQDAKNAPIREAGGYRIYLKVLGVSALENLASYRAYLNPADGRLTFEEVVLEKVSYPDCSKAALNPWANLNQMRQEENERQAFEPTDALTPERDDTYPYFVATTHLRKKKEPSNVPAIGAEFVSTVLDPDSRTRVTEFKIPAVGPRSRPAGFTKSISNAFAHVDAKTTRQYALAYSVKFSEGFEFGTGGVLPGYGRENGPGSYQVALGWNQAGLLVARVRDGNRSAEYLLSQQGQALQVIPGAWMSFRSGIQLPTAQAPTSRAWITINGSAAEIEGQTMRSLAHAGEAPDEVVLQVYRNALPPQAKLKGGDAVIRMKAYGNTGNVL